MSQAGCCQEFRSSRVCKSCMMGIALTPIHISPCRAVKKNIGSFSLQDTLDGRIIWFIQPCMVQARNIGASTEAVTNQRSPDHSPGSCDDYLHPFRASAILLRVVFAIRAAARVIDPLRIVPIPLNSLPQAGFPCLAWRPANFTFN